MSKSFLQHAKDFIQSKGIEKDFLTQTGLSSLDELSPANFDNFETEPPITMKPSTSSGPTVLKEQPRTLADAQPHPETTTASEMLRPYIGFKINYKARKQLSSYQPSALMMDHIIHLMNILHCDSFHIRRECPDYHPYVIRLYYGVLFIIQTLRAGLAVKALSYEDHQTLAIFLEAFPPENLPIASPLLPLFKTLCASQPELPNYGKVYPKLPTPFGPDSRSDFIRDQLASFICPNVPGIFALLEDLNSKINPPEGQAAAYPNKGKHIPVSSTATQAVTFGHHSFPVPATRSNLEKWALVSSGLQYPCEADKKLNEQFAERIGDFSFPTTTAEDDLTEFLNFLNLETSMEWFASVCEVAAKASSYFEGSGYLSDCPPVGIAANQILVVYSSPATAPAAPTCNADRNALFPFSIRLDSPSRNLPEMAEAMAAMAQTNIRMPANHPYLGNYGTDLTRPGPFWDIRPIESSVKDESSYLSLRERVGKLHRTPKRSG